MRRNKFNIIMVTFFVLIMYGVLPVMAQTGSISIQSDVLDEAALVKIADLENGIMVLDEKFSDLNINLNDMDSAEQVMEAAKTFAKYEQKDQTVTVSDGILEAEGLTEGAYLIYDANKKDEITFSPAIIQIPQLKEDKTLEYDVKIQPKCVSVRESEVPKTGDTSEFVLYTALILGSIVVLLLLMCVFILPKFRI